MPIREREPYERAIADAWDAVDIYRDVERFLDTYSRVDVVVGLVFAANFCQSEVRNGGLHQFFGNPTGVLAPEAVAGFRAMGLDEAAAVVEEAMAFFGPRYPRAVEDRAAALDAVPGESREEWDPFFRIDERFYSALRGADVDRFVEAANAFVSRGVDRAG